jgi:hypothetical protein
MKKLFILLLFNSFVSYSQIPNHDFGYWSIINGVEEPDNWVTNNIPSHISVEKSTISYSGNFAAKIISNGPSFEGPAPGWLKTTVSLIEPVNQLSFYYRCDTIIAPAIGEVVVKAWINGDPEISNYEISEQTTAYQQINLPLSINELPDSLTIQIISKTINDGTFYVGYIELLVDSFSLSFSTGVEENLRLLNEIIIFPNPSNSILNIEVPDNVFSELLRFKIFTLDGRSVLEGELQSGYNKIDIRQFKKGAYIVQTTNEELFVNKRFIIN